MTRKIEWRHYFGDELRAIDESDGEPKVEGYPAMFDKYSEDLGGFVERIAPGAFKKSLKNGADVRALWNHDQNFVLGRTKSGTVKLREDDKGLYMINRPPNTQWARDLMVSIGRKDVTQMSFGFWVVDDEWKERKDKPPVRTLNEVELVDVSVVTFPAYPDTKVALISMEAWQKKTQPEEEHEKKDMFSLPEENDIIDIVAKATSKNPELIRAIQSLVENNEENEDQITITDGDNSFIFRDFEQFDRVVAKVVEMREKETEATQSRAEEKDEDIEGTQSRPVDVMKRLGKRVTEKGKERREQIITKPKTE